MNISKISTQDLKKELEKRQSSNDNKLKNIPEYLIKGYSKLTEGYVVKEDFKNLGILQVECNLSLDSWSQEINFYCSNACLIHKDKHIKKINYVGSEELGNTVDAMLNN